MSSVGRGRRDCANNNYLMAGIRTGYTKERLVCGSSTSVHVEQNPRYLPFENHHDSLFCGNFEFYIICVHQPNPIDIINFRFLLNNSNVWQVGLIEQRC